MPELSLRLKSYGVTKQYLESLTGPAYNLAKNFAASSVMNGTIDPIDTRDALSFCRLFLNSSNLQVDQSFWESLDPHYGVEVWSDDFKYLFSCGKFISATSYGLDQLLETPWHQLFERSEIHTKQIENAWMKVLQTGQPALNVTASHIVKEKYAKQVSLLVAVKGIFPVYLRGEHETGPVCIIAMTELKRPA